MRKIIILFIATFILSLFANSDYAVSEAIAPLLIPAIMGGIGVVSQALGAAKAAKLEKENRRLLDVQQNENLANYVSDYYRGALDNPGSRAYLKKLDETMRDTTKATENRAISTGATQENVLAAKQANNEVMSDAVGNIIQGEESRKDAVKERYLQRKSGLVAGEMGANTQRAQNWISTTQGIANAAGNLASAYLLQDNPSLFRSGNPGTVDTNYAASFDSQIRQDAASQLQKNIVK